MGIFGKTSEGGFMDVIRCDEKEFLIWEWRPSGEANSTRKEIAIRWKSSLWVKDGELAVFVYSQYSGVNQDFVEGPHDQSISTKNFPILASIVGLAFGGDSPFQAEVYFINLAGNMQVRFAVPYFDVFDPRFLDFGVPTAVRGTITFNITDYRTFVKLNRMINFEPADFSRQIKSALQKYVKGVVANIPEEMGMPPLQMERKILEINDRVNGLVKPRLEQDFGVNVKGFDIDTIDFDKQSTGYRELKRITADQVTATVTTQNRVALQNMEDMQRINAGNMEETLRMQREEAQRAQRLQTESAFLNAHQINQQASVAKAAAESMGKMGQGGGGGGGLNPGSMMAEMAMGGAVGAGMAGMIGNTMQGLNQPQPPPVPQPGSQYHLAVNGQTQGPFGIDQLRQMASSGQFLPGSHVWKAGMAGWVAASTVAELAPCFAPSTPPPPPPPPPSPPLPPAAAVSPPAPGMTPLSQPPPGDAT